MEKAIYLVSSVKMGDNLIVFRVKAPNRATFLFSWDLMTGDLFHLSRDNYRPLDTDDDYLLNSEISESDVHIATFDIGTTVAEMKNNVVGWVAEYQSAQRRLNPSPFW